LVVAEQAHRGRVEQKILAGGWWEADPACRDHAEQVAVSEERHTSLHATDAVDQSIDAGSDLLRRFPTRTPVVEHHPVRCGAPDLLGGEPFVLAVIPLHEVRVDFHASAESRQLTRLT